jgi:ankyrin repeat protein
MRWALHMNDLEDVARRLDSGEEWFGAEFNGLITCAFHGFTEMTKLLLEHGADPNQKAGPKDTKFENFTPLHALGSAPAEDKLWRHSPRRLRHRALEIAEALLAAGADPNAADKFGNGPLHTAEFNDFGELAELLVARGYPFGGPRR